MYIVFYVYLKNSSNSYLHSNIYSLQQKNVCQSYLCICLNIKIIRVKEKTLILNAQQTFQLVNMVDFFRIKIISNFATKILISTNFSVELFISTQTL